MNKDHLKVFINDPVNILLAQFFASNNGLERTDPTGEKPSCRADSLMNLLELGNRQPEKVGL